MTMQSTNSEKRDFAEYFNSRLFSDCIVISSCDKKFRTHKIVLSKNEFFRKKLLADPNRFSAMNLPETADILEDLLYYLYSGRIKGTCKNVKALLIAARKYLFTDLETSMVKNMLDTLSADNAIQYLLFVHRQELLDSENEIIDFVINDLKGVMQTKDWNLLDPEEFARLKDKIIEAYIKHNERNMIESSLMLEQEMKV